MRLAEEYDAAQERGEIGKQGAHFKEGKVRGPEAVPPNDLHAARKLRDAERRERSGRADAARVISLRSRKRRGPPRASAAAGKGASDGAMRRA